MHDGAVSGNDKIRAASLDFLEQWKPAPAGALLCAKNTNVASSVANERVIRRGKVGYHDFAGCAVRLDIAVFIDYFDNDVFGCDVPP